MTCCCAHALLHVFGEAVKTGGRRQVHHVARDSGVRAHTLQSMFATR
jgi:hypothetical protein